MNRRLTIIIILCFMIQASLSGRSNPFPSQDMYRGQSECVDSDDGADMYTAGIAKGKLGKSYKDVCISSSTLSEGICIQNSRFKVGRKLIYCPLGCKNGACSGEKKIKPIITTRSSYLIPFMNITSYRNVFNTTTRHGITCVDTDNGVDKSVLGQIFINDRRMFGDACISPSSLQEAYCKSSKRSGFEVATIYCMKGCRYGRCI